MKKLLTRTLAGIAYVGVIAGGLLVSKYLFLVLFLLIMTLMMHEFHVMTMGDSYKVQQFLSTFTGWCAFVLVFFRVSFGMAPGLLALCFVPLFALLVSLLFIKDRDELEKVSHAFNSILYIALPLVLLNFLVFRNYSFDGKILLWLMVLVWMSDIGAYVFGMALGQKYGPKLCPSISPKKSWIGAVGGLVVTVGSAVALCYIGLLPYGIWHCIALAVIIDVMGVFGDLVESIWKRNAGLKDSGNLIPGHGGMMDRFDSALLALSASAVYLLCTGLIQA